MNSTNESFVIRKMIRGDLPCSIFIIRKGFLANATRNGFEKMLQDNKQIACRVATVDDVIVAIIVYLLAEEFIKILILAVAQEWQGRGCGKKLVQMVEYQAEGVSTRKEVFAAIPESLLPQGADFLAHRGYMASGIEKGLKPDQPDLIIMHKPINKDKPEVAENNVVGAK